MRLLLDTHVVLWSITNPEKLSTRVKNLISDESNLCFVSIAALWEIAIKSSIGRLELKTGLDHVFQTIVKTGFEILPIDGSHIINVAQLPFHHRDPFDRIFIAQAAVEDMVLVSKDEHFDKYPIKVIWE